MKNPRNEQAKHCKNCEKIIRDYNKSGFCNKCYQLNKYKLKKEKV